MARPPTGSELRAAARLLDATASLRPAGHGPSAAAARAYDTLVQSFGPVIGTASVQAVFARVVKLTGAEYPRLGDRLAAAARGEGDGEPVAVVCACVAELEPGEAWSLATRVYAHFFALMTTLVGGQLVRQLVRTAFPADEPTTPEEDP